jgi:hypothetical protein
VFCRGGFADPSASIDLCRQLRSEEADNTKGTCYTKTVDVAYDSDEDLHLVDIDFIILRNLLHTYHEWLLVAQVTVVAPLRRHDKGSMVGREVRSAFGSM